jgi:hypothetical protein
MPPDADAPIWMVGVGTKPSCSSYVSPSWSWNAASEDRRRRLPLRTFDSVLVSATERFLDLPSLLVPA